VENRKIIEAWSAKIPTRKKAGLARLRFSETIADNLSKPVEVMLEATWVELRFSMLEN